MADDPVSDDTLEFKPWRDLWRVHEAVDRMPMAAADEQEQLALDIKRRGLAEQLVFLIEGDYEPEEHGAEARISLIDGRNRLDALDRIGFRFAHPPRRGPLMQDPEGEITDLFCRYLLANDNPYPFEIVVSLNLVRRHLTTAQKRQVIGELLKDMAELSNREIARLAKVDDKTVATVRQHLERLGELVPQDVTIGRDNRVRTARARRAPPVEARETVKVEKDRLARLGAAQRARDSGDLFTWAKDGPAAIAHVLVQDGCAQASLAKVQLVAQAMLNEAKRLDREAREAQRAVKR